MRDKPFASLTSGLLARKGQARPAMRPQPIAGLQEAEFDLGWDDMGEDFARPTGPRLPPDLSAPPLAVTPPLPVVRQQQDQIAREFENRPVEDKAPSGPASLLTMPLPRRRPGGRRAAFTLRLDNDRHLRLRLACAITGRSAQHLVTDALDALLATHPEVERLATNLPAETRED